MVSLPKLKGTGEPPSYSVTGECNGPHPLYDSSSWKDVRQYIEIHFAPISDAATYDKHKTEWKAFLFVKVKDLPRLMRDGFHWTSANFHRETSFIKSSIDWDSIRAQGWLKSRTYYLSDLGTFPRWAAKLVVCTRRLDVLARFSLDSIQPGLACEAWALGGSSGEKRYYRFHRFHPGWNFNTLYNNMPLEGWWPWPKREQEATAYDAAMQQKSELVSEAASDRLTRQQKEKLMSKAMSLLTKGGSLVKEAASGELPKQLKLKTVCDAGLLVLEAVELVEDVIYSEVPKPQKSNRWSMISRFFRRGGGQSGGGNCRRTKEQEQN